MEGSAANSERYQNGRVVLAHVHDSDVTDRALPTLENSRKLTVQGSGRKEGLVAFGALRSQGEDLQSLLGGELGAVQHERRRQSRVRGRSSGNLCCFHVEG